MTLMRSIRTTVADLPDPDPKILALLEAWKSARGDRLVPLKRDFDPFSVPKLLKKVWLYGLEPNGTDFVCRLAGEDINMTWGGSIAGRAAKSLFGEDDHKIVAGIWHDVLDTPLIHYGKLERMQETTLHAAERIVLPLLGDDSDPIPGYILGMSLYGVADLDRVRPEKILRDAYHINCADIE